MGGPPSYGNYSPLTTSFDVSVYGGSRNASQHGGSRHHHAQLHGTPAVGGHFVGGCSVISLVAGSLLLTSLDASETSLTTSRVTKLRQHQLPLKRMFLSSWTSPQSRTNRRTSASYLSRTKNHGLMPRRSLSLVFAVHHIGLALPVTSL